MRVTAKTNLAMRTLMFCALNGGALVQKSQVARAVNASENHLALVIQQLGRAGFIITRRGRAGGIALARPADQITVAEIFEAFEADLPFAECYDPESNTCPLSGACRLRRTFDRALAAFYGELAKVTLEELVCDNAPLAAILSLPDAVRACPAREAQG